MKDTVRAGCAKSARPVRGGRTARQSGRAVLYSTASHAFICFIQMDLPHLIRQTRLGDSGPVLLGRFGTGLGAEFPDEIHDRLSRPQAVVLGGVFQTLADDDGGAQEK